MAAEFHSFVVQQHQLVERDGCRLEVKDTEIYFLLHCCRNHWNFHWYPIVVAVQWYSFGVGFAALLDRVLSVECHCYSHHQQLLVFRSRFPSLQFCLL